MGIVVVVMVVFLIVIMAVIVVMVIKTDPTMGVRNAPPINNNGNSHKQ